MILSGATNGNFTRASHVETFRSRLQGHIHPVRFHRVTESNALPNIGKYRTFLVFNFPPRRPSAHSTSTTAATALREDSTAQVLRRGATPAIPFFFDDRFCSERLKILVTLDSSEAIHRQVLSWDGATQPTTIIHHESRDKM